MAADDSSDSVVNIPTMYFNGFQLALSNADVSAILLLNNVPQSGISMSYTTAKTLSLALAEMVETLEKVTGRNIMTTREVGAGLETLSPKEAPDGNIH